MRGMGTTLLGLYTGVSVNSLSDPSELRFPDLCKRLCCWAEGPECECLLQFCIADTLVASPWSLL